MENKERQQNIRISKKIQKPGTKKKQNKKTEKNFLSNLSNNDLHSPAFNDDIFSQDLIQSPILSKRNVLRKEKTNKTKTNL